MPINYPIEWKHWPPLPERLEVVHFLALSLMPGSNISYVLAVELVNNGIVIFLTSFNKKGNEFLT